jgi:site-specific DNA recombinase
MAGVNAFRSRGDGEKVKGGLARKHADGGSMGPARIGYLNDVETVEGRRIATISVDHDRVHFVQLAFDLAASGEHTITTITGVLADAGLRTRATRTRPSKPLSRSMVHRMLRDDYYIGIVTLKGVKREGRHEPIIDPATFERAQQVLDAHRASGDRTHKHGHYLKGTLQCACGKRLGYGRHRGKCGAVYEYFSCLSRVQRGGRCPAPYFPVDRTEHAVVLRYRRETYKPDEQDAIRQALREYVDSKAEVARRNSKRHDRRLRELTGQQQKLLQAFYNGGVDEDVLRAEQARIETERAQARKWAEAAVREVQDVMDALDNALLLLDDEHVLYETLPQSLRRMVNQAVFVALVVCDPETIQAKHAPLYEALASLNRALQQPKNTPHKAAKRRRTPQNKTRPQIEPDPFSGGRGPYIEHMAERAGFEPAMELLPHTRLAGECLQPLGHLSREIGSASVEAGCPRGASSGGWEPAST